MGRMAVWILHGIGSSFATFVFLWLAFSWHPPMMGLLVAIPGVTLLALSTYALSLLLGACIGRVPALRNILIHGLLGPNGPVQRTREGDDEPRGELAPARGSPGARPGACRDLLARDEATPPFSAWPDRERTGAVPRRADDRHGSAGGARLSEGSSPSSEAGDAPSSSPRTT